MSNRRNGRMSRTIAVMATAALSGGLVALTATPAQAAALTVDSIDDTAIPGDDVCTLREAIANADTNSDTTDGDCAAGSGADTITFASTATGTITLVAQLPVVTDAEGLTITGPGAAELAISGNDVVRLFEVQSNASLSLSGLTLTDGRAASGDGGAILNHGTVTVISAIVTGNSATFSGGAIDTDGTLTLTDSTFSGNTAEITGGGAIRGRAGTVQISGSSFTANSGSVGGAIETSGFLSVTDSSFESNASTGSGGAVSANALTVSGSVFTGNTAGSNGDGGAIQTTGTGLLTVTESTFTGNRSGFGGGAIQTLFGTDLAIVRSTFAENSATQFGGAIEANRALTITLSTFDRNSAPRGGAVWATTTLQPVSVRNSTFSDNTATSGAASLHRQNGPVSGSGSIFSVAADQVNCAGTGTVTDDGSNIDSGDSCGFTAPADAAWGSNVDASLSALADNGGPTETLLPSAGSPAIDAIEPGELRCPGASPANDDLDTDQRGVVRPQGPKCDIGAVEVEAEPTVYTVSAFGKPVKSESGTTRLKAGETLPLKFSVTDSDGERITDLQGEDVTVGVLLTTCGTTVVAVDVEFPAGSALLLRNDGSYQIDVKTQKAWAGLCGTVTVRTPNDGERSANVEITGAGRGRG